MRVLGIETSCDETSVAIVDDGHHVLCNLIASQYDLHAKYGGVVPELASRAHVLTLDLMVREALKKAGCGVEQIDAIAVTRRPGLIGSLLIGVTAAKTLAWSWDKPLIGVNHVHAHATSATIDLPPGETLTPPSPQGGIWPALALVVSGGHTSLFHVNSYDDINPMGATIDDAAGEAFDKVAMMLGLAYPGGPHIDIRAQRGRSDSHRFPRTMLDPQSLDFSFSGLKTAVLYHVHGVGQTSGGLEKLSESDIDDICASFSAAVVSVLVAKTMRAVEQAGVQTVIIGGGVAANSMLRKRMLVRCEESGLRLCLTPQIYCTDNAAMIAALGGHLMESGHRDNLSLSASASF